MGRIRGGGGGGGCCNIYEERVHISDHKVHVGASQQPAAPGTQLPVRPTGSPKSTARSSTLELRNLLLLLGAAVDRCDAASISAALAACSALPPSTWPLAICRGFVACLPETVFSRCRALRSRASSEELKARNAKRKLKNLQFCHHADNAKFEKAIPVPTHASTLHPPTQRPSPPRRPASYHRWRACARSV